MVYTGDDAPFDWDDANVEHIARHGVSPEEAEEALRDERRQVTRARSGVERRWNVIGATSSGRLLSVIYAQRRSAIRVVTAPARDQS